MKLDTLTPQQWEQVESLFNDLVTLPEPERDSFIDLNCREQWLAEALRQLLTADKQDDSISGSDQLLDVGKLTAQLERESEPPKSVGRYVIEKELGRGGSSVVYLATRSDIGGSVALKLLRNDPLAAKEVRQRFLFEHRLLARLEHPRIARMLDAGVTEGGTAFLAMEYVEGLPLTEYCSAHALGLTARLHLFLQVCEAVEYAHRHLIIHRDLKPGNILVDAKGQVRLLDFGIAKLLEAEDGVSPVTRTGARLMTPEYAAPEQILGEAVSTAVDVYALGVVLYELLAAKRPFGDRKAGLSGLERAIIERVPANPSTSEAAGRWRRQLRGDLDAVVMQCMRKEPSERYDSVGHLSADLRRFLRGEPLDIGGGHFTYRARKFVLRNRVPVVTSVAILVLLGGLTWREMSLRQTAELALSQARSEAAKNQRITDFLVDLFDTADARSTQIDQSREMTAREILDRGANRIESQLADQPDAQATLRLKISDAYFSMTRLDDASEQLEVALALRRTLGEPLGIAEVLSRQAQIAIWQGDYERVLELEQAALTYREANLSPPHRDLATSYSHIGTAYMWTERLEAAEDYLLRALDMRRAADGDNIRAIAEDLSELGHLQQQLGDFARAEAYYRESSGLIESYLEHMNPTAVEARRVIALSVMNQGRVDEAAGLLESVARDYRTLYESGGSPSDLSHTLSLAGNIAEQKGDLVRAEALHREALMLDALVVPDDHAWIATHKRNLAQVLVGAGKLDEAQELLQQALSANLAHDRIRRAAFDQGVLAQVRIAQKDSDGALVAFTGAIQGLAQTSGEAHPDMEKQLTLLITWLAESGFCPGVHEAADAWLGSASRKATAVTDDIIPMLSRCRNGGLQAGRSEASGEDFAG